MSEPPRMDFVERLRRLSPLLLMVFNGILVVAGWSLAIYVYPRLPSRIPLWLRASPGDPRLFAKSGLFFLYPLAQTAVVAGLALLAERRGRRAPTCRLSLLRREHMYLSLIFVNLVFIHLQRSVIGLSVGVFTLSWPYLAALSAFIVVIYFYYRWQARMVAKVPDSPACRKD